MAYLLDRTGAVTDTELDKAHTQNSDTGLGTLGTKTTPVDADLVVQRDSADSSVVKTSTWTQVKAFLKTYFDSIYATLGANADITSMTALSDEGIPHAAIANLQGNKNAIINGDFNIWQRGTSFAAIATAAYSVDSFQAQHSGTAAITISRDTDVPTQAESGHKSNYSMKLDVTTADASITAGDYFVFHHIIEGYNFAPFQGRTATLSFWVKAVKTGIYTVTFRNSVANMCYPAEYTINSASTWEKKTITLTFNSPTGTWNYTNGIGLHIDWGIASGSSFHTTVDAWYSGSSLGTTNQVNGVDSTDNNFWLAQVQLELGSTATDFEYRTIGQEKSLCDRYYINYTARTINGDLWLSWPVTMRAAPTLTDTVGTAANPTVNGCTINHNAAADVTVTASAEL